MPLRVPASFELSVHYDIALHKLDNAINVALRRLRWKYKHLSPGHFAGTRPMTFWSWGEKFEIVTNENGDVKMVSTSRVPITVISWGKNEENVRDFFEQLDKDLQEVTDKC